MNMILNNVILYTPWKRIENASVEVKDGRVHCVSSEKIKTGEDLKGMFLVPGFIDTHLHGYAGIDVTSVDVDGLLELAKVLPKHGVTAFVPTVPTTSHPDLLKACSVVAKAQRIQREDPRGARILGVHLEGPYLNPERSGAQNPCWLRLPNVQEFHEYWRASEGSVRIVTIAPELPGALEVISKLTELGVVASIGHTQASYEEAKAAIYAGIRRATHLFNAMPSIHHRAPGAAVACLEAQNVYLELIFDLIHVASPVLRLVWKLVGPERIVAITDAIAAAGLSNGVYTLAGLPVEVKGGIARLKDGTLAGSTLSLAQCVRNMVQIGIPMEEALVMASVVPAQSIGEALMGTIAPGAPADFVVLDHQLNVQRTYIAGKLCFTRDL